MEAIVNIIAVDGPAASGKSTIARGIAQALQYRYVNSGALYRAIAYALLKGMVDLSDGSAVVRALERLTIGFDVVGERYLIDGDDVTKHLQRRDVSVHASKVAQLYAVRERVNRELREIADGHDCVVEGRDIGSVVFPAAGVKVYLEATLEVRARRRMVDYQRQGAGHAIEEIVSELRERDEQDSTRSIAPLRPPEGAIVVNSTDMTPDEVVHHILALVKEKLK
jgi:cytidylate kinase